MATEVSPVLLSDAQRILNELRRRPRGYRYIRELVGNDATRALNALDRLDGLGLIRQRKIRMDTHYEAAPAASP